MAAIEAHRPLRAAEPRGSLRAWAMTIVLLLFCIFAIVDRTVIAMLVDPIRKDLGISDTQIALLLGIAYAAAYAIGGLPMGWLVDKFPRRWLLFLAVSFWGLAEAACGLVTGFAGLFAARAAVGLFESPLHPASHSLIADSFPKRRLGFAMSVYSSGNLIGTGLALIIGGWIVQLLSQHTAYVLPVLGSLKPWQIAFVATGLPGLLLAVLILAFREPARAAHAAHEKGSWAELWSFIRRHWRVSIALSVAFGGMNIVNGAMIKWQPAYLSRFFHMSPAEYGLKLGLVTAVAGVTGLLFSGWLVDRLFTRGRKDAHLTYYMWVIILTSPFVAWGMISSDVRLFFAGVLIAKFATVNFLGLAAAVIQLISPQRLRGRLSAIFFLMIIALLGTSLGPLVSALISDHLLHDHIRIGRAMAIMLGVFAPLAVIAILWGRKPLREAIDAAEVRAAEAVA
jgi:MFS family permease